MPTGEEGHVVVGVEHDAPGVEEHDLASLAEDVRLVASGDGGSLAQTSGSSNAWGGNVIEPWVTVDGAASAEPANASAAVASAALDTAVRRNHLAWACSDIATASSGRSVVSRRAFSKPPSQRDKAEPSH
jgi:hypothetical protein